jgi:hypothetical protein
MPEQITKYPDVTLRVLKTSRPPGSQAMMIATVRCEGAEAKK